MGFLNLLSAPVKITAKETYNFLVVAALQEELNEFYKVNNSFKTQIPKSGGANEISFDCNGSLVKILTYTPNKMGMPFNAAAIMNIISVHQPLYTFMIGTCAGIGRKHNLGDVLIPDRVFSYESGKYDNGTFKPDYFAHSTGDELRKQAELLKSLIGDVLEFNVTTDDDLCSGAAVVDDEKMVEQIIDRGSRKVSGLDMEAYSIACINTVLKGQKELLVIKGISDFAKNKGDAEIQGNKELAKKNSAAYAFALIKHLQETTLGIQNVYIKKK